ncbi:MAG: CDP-diacylglycerol--glycerol-3-phosphate 3-phosphatidyltransferase [Alphaproteobacteria bacterium]
MFTLNALPNWMTIMRIAITPLIAVLIWIDEPPYGYQLALALYTIASVTDYIDGYMARRLKVESPLGEMLDPIADKLLVAAVLLALANVTNSGWLFLVPALIILIREFMISGLREFLAKQNLSAPVTRLAKWKTTAQILALGFLMGAPGFPGFPFAHEIGITLLWLAAILTVQTGSGYLISAVKHVTNSG